MAESAPGQGLVGEVEAFLGGSSGEWFERAALPVPVWAYVNEIAHRDTGHVARLAAASTPGGDPECWHDTLVVIARQLVEFAGGDAAAIRRAQLDRLVPLELQLLWFQPSTPLSPAGLAALGRARLYHRAGAS